MIMDWSKYYRTLKEVGVIHCYRKLQRLAKQHSITLRWVLSHSEISANKFADELARAISDTPRGPELTNWEMGILIRID